MERGDAQFLYDANTGFKKAQCPITFRAALSFAVEKNNKTDIIAFGRPPYPTARSTPKDTTTCFNCGAEGHTAKSCPEPPKEKPEKSAKKKSGKLVKKKEQQKPAEIHTEIVIYIQPDHISHMALEFNVAYHETSADWELTRRYMDLKLWSSNLQAISANAISSNDEASLEVLAKTFDTSLNTITEWANEKDLWLVSMELRPDSPFYVAGTNFFTHNSFGEFTEQIEAVRSYLSTRGKKSAAKIQALVRSDEDIKFQLEFLWESIEAQRKDDRLRYWWKNEVNCQLGMQLAKDLRPRYTIPAKATFFDQDEYLTIQYYGILEQHEEVKASAIWHHVNARFATLPFGARKYFMFIQMTPTFRLSPGDRVAVCLDLQTDDRTKDWIANVVTPLPFATSQDYTTILSRPFIRDNEEVEEVEEIEEEEEVEGEEEGHFNNLEIPPQSVLKLTDQTDTESARQKITAMPPTIVKIMIETSDETTRRQINTLRELQQNQARHHAWTLELLRASNLRSIRSCDAFGHILKSHTEDELQQAIQRFCSNHNEEQCQADQALRQIPAGLLLIQGSPGTGKTTWIINNIEVCYSFATIQEPAQIVVLSGTNGPLDDLAVKIFDQLYAIYQQDQKKFPVVIREHSVETEISIYKREAALKRTAIIGPRVQPPTLDTTIDITNLAVAHILLQTYQDAMTQKFQGISDKRVQVLNLSLGMWMLRAAGLPVHNGGPHPIAHPDPKKFSTFRSLLQRFENGEMLNPKENQCFTEAAARVREYVHELADVQLATLNNYLQEKVHSGLKANLVISDESARATEADAIGAFTWNSAPVRIFVGDVYQLKPPATGKQHLAFSTQMRMSFFSRALAAGYKLVRFNTQHRYSKSICGILNALGYRHLVTHPSVETRHTVRMAKDFMKKTFGITGTVCFLNLPSGKEQKSVANPSKRNLGNIKLAFYIYMVLLLRGWEAKDIGITTPYTAQAQQYIASHHNMVQYLATYDINPHHIEKMREQANKIHETAIFTFDSIQGLEREVIILDLTVSENMGFLKDPARLMVGLSRPRSMLIIIGNIEGLEANRSPQFKRSTLSMLIQYCKTHNFRFDVTNHIAEAWQAEFATADDLGEKRIHFVRNNAMNTQFAFKPTEKLHANLPNINELGPADAEFHPSLPTVPTVNEPMDTPENKNEEMGESNWTEEDNWNEGDDNWNKDTDEQIDNTDEQIDNTDEQIDMGWQQRDGW